MVSSVMRDLKPAFSDSRSELSAFTTNYIPFLFLRRYGLVEFRAFTSNQLDLASANEKGLFFPDSMF